MNINIKVMGAGCTKCRNLEKITNEVVKENNLDAEVLKIEDIVQIMSYGVMTTPALVVNGKVVASGRVPTKSEILSFIKREVYGI
jgi:small redox-active disulfide protein 2